MSVHDLSVDFGRFYRPENKISRADIAKTSPTTTYKKKEMPRFWYIESANKQLDEYRAKGEKQTKRLETVITVIKLFMMFLSVLMPLSMSYLPAWVTWGIGLPTIFATLFLQVKLMGKVEIAKNQIEHFLLLKEFLKHHSMQSLHPFGEWDLSAKDNRLKSDEVAEKELKKVHPGSAQSIEDSLKYLDLEVTHDVQRYASHLFSNKTDLTAKWKAVESKFADSTRYLLNTEREKGVAEQCEALQIAYQDHDANDFAQPTVREKAEGILRHYQASYLLFDSKKKSHHLFEKMEAWLQEGEKLYENYPYIKTDDWRQEWEKHLEFAGEVKGKLAELIELLEKNNPSATEVELSLALQKIDENKVTPDLVKLVYQANQLQKRVQIWIEEHPEKKLAEMRKEINAPYGKTVVSRDGLKALVKWTRANPLEAEKKCSEIPESCPLPDEVSRWLEKHYVLRFKTPLEIFDALFNLRREWDEAYKRQELLVSQWLKVNSCEKYAAYERSLEAFKKEVKEPLMALVDRKGEPSKAKYKLQPLYTVLPAAPFMKGKIPKEKALKLRKLEELRLDKMLRSQDSKIMGNHKARVWLLRMPMILINCVAMIVSIYVTSHLIFIGASVACTILGGISLYVDHRLRQMDKEKQGIKLQSELIDRPDIGVIPGNRPRLAELKDMQQRLGIDGVRPTWARTLAVGEEVIQKPKDLEDAKKIMKKMGEEGSKLAEKHLKNRLVSLRSDYVELNPKSSQAKKLKRKIDRIATALERVPENREDPEFKVSDHLEKRQAEKDLETVAEKIGVLKAKRKDYKQRLRLLKSLPDEIEDLKKRHGLIQKAMEGEHPRESQEDIEAIWKIGSEVQPERLKVLSKDVLLIEGQKIDGVLNRLKRIYLRVLEDKEYALEHTQDALASLIKESEHWKDENRYLNALLDGGYVSPQTLSAKIKVLNKELKVEKEKLPPAVPERELVLKEKGLAKLLNTLNGVLKECDREVAKLEVPQNYRRHVERYKAMKLRAFRGKVMERYREEVRRMYFDLSASEQSSIWWSLPLELREELSGDQLVAWCWKMDKESDKRETLWKNQQSALEELFDRVEPSRQAEAYSALPPFFKEKLAPFFEKSVGKNLTDMGWNIVFQHRKERSKEKRALLLNESWGQIAIKFCSQFQQLPVYHQENVYRSLPESVRLLFKPLYGAYSGSLLVADCQKEYNKILAARHSVKKLEVHWSELFKSWWEKRGKVFMENFKKIDQRYLRSVCARLPAPILEKIQQEIVLN